MVDKLRCRACGLEYGESAAEGNHRCPDCGTERSGRQAGDCLPGKGVAKSLVGIALLLILGGGLYLVWKAGPGGGEGSVKAAEIERILQTAQEVNRKTPLMIDNSTRLDQVVIEAQTVIYKTTLVNLTSENADQAIFKKKIGPFLAGKYCDDVNSRKALALGIKYGHEYFGKDGVLLYTAKISVEDC